MKQSVVLESIIIYVVRVLRRLFHYTPIHRLKITQIIYREWVAYMTRGKKKISLEFREIGALRGWGDYQFKRYL